MQLPDLLRAIRASAAPRRVQTRIVAVDGPGGSGKTTLAERLAAELPAPVVHTDDFASWDEPLEWWPQLLELVLEPLARGHAARYEPKAWGGPPTGLVEIAPAEFLVLDGVGSSRDAFRPYLAYTIWVETPRELRLARGLERDGEDALPLWLRWIAEEDAYIERERPDARADAVVSGDQPSGCDASRPPAESQG